MALLETKKISINFGGLWAVKDVDFNVEPNKIVGLIGPNGSGKTTFLNIISGIYGRYKGTSGEVYLDGEYILGLKPCDVYKKGMSRTYQSSRLCWEQSVADNLLVGCYTSQDYSLFDSIFRVPAKIPVRDSTIVPHVKQPGLQQEYIAPQTSFVKHPDIDNARVFWF